MARVTIEDCLEHVPNRFDLVILAARRARQLAKGEESTIVDVKDKDTVLALREIGANSIDLEGLMLDAAKAEERKGARTAQEQVAAPAEDAEAAAAGEAPTTATPEAGTEAAADEATAQEAPTEAAAASAETAPAESAEETPAAAAPTTEAEDAGSA